MRTREWHRSDGRRWRADLDRRSSAPSACQDDGHRRRCDPDGLLQLDPCGLGKLGGPQLVSSATVAAKYATHWRERLAVSVRFDRREDWGRASLAEAR